MSLFGNNNTPQSVDPIEVYKLVQEQRRLREQKQNPEDKALFGKPETERSFKALDFMDFFVGALDAKAQAAREEVQPSMEELARRSAEEAALFRMESGVKKSLSAPYKKPTEDVQVEVPVVEKSAVEEEEVDTYDAESLPVEATTKQEDKGLMSRPVKQEEQASTSKPKADVYEDEEVYTDYEGVPEYVKPGSAFRAALSKHEAESYKTIFGNAQKSGGKFEGVDVTKMTMAEVFDFTEAGGAFNQYNKDTHGKNTTAIGKYQMVGATLRDLRDRGTLDKLGITEDTPFNQKTQDTIAAHLAERRVKGKSRAAARSGLKNEWEGFKKLSKAELDTIIDEIGF